MLLDIYLVSSSLVTSQIIVSMVCKIDRRHLIRPTTKKCWNRKDKMCIHDGLSPKILGIWEEGMRVWTCLMTSFSSALVTFSLVSRTSRSFSGLSCISSWLPLGSFVLSAHASLMPFSAAVQREQNNMANVSLQQQRHIMRTINVKMTDVCHSCVIRQRGKQPPMCPSMFLGLWRQLRMCQRALCHFDTEEIVVCTSQGQVLGCQASRQTSKRKENPRF